jgi:hypothetical protein
MDVRDVMASRRCEWTLSRWNHDPISGLREQGIVRSDQLAGHNDGRLDLSCCDDLLVANEY